MKNRFTLPSFAFRSVDLTRRLDTFLVCAIAAVLGYVHTFAA